MCKGLGVVISEAVAKIHRWLVRLPKSIYRLLLGFYATSSLLALILMVVPEPIYGNRPIWALDVVVLTAFGLSHVRFRRHGEQP